MTEINQTSSDPNWQQTETALVEVVIAAFADKLGNESDELSDEKFQLRMFEVFPSMTPKQLKSAVHFNSWGARNVVVNQLGELDPAAVHEMTTTLAAMAGGDETSRRAAQYIEAVCGTRERSEAIPMLKLLSSMAVARSATT